MNQSSARNQLALTAAIMFCLSCTKADDKERDKTPDVVSQPVAVSEPTYEEAPIKLLEPDPNLTCESALAQLTDNQTKVKSGIVLTPDMAAAAQAAAIKIFSCNLPSDETNTVVTIGKESTKAYSVPRGAKFEKLCQTVIDVAGGKIVEKAGGAAGAVATLYGRSITCPSGAETVQKKQGALLILSPNLVQGRYVTKALLLKLKLYDHAKRAGQDVEKFVDENKDNVALTTVFSPVIVADKLTGGKISEQGKRIDDDLDISENAKDTGRSLEKRGKKICGNWC